MLLKRGEEKELSILDIRETIFEDGSIFRE